MKNEQSYSRPQKTADRLGDFAKDRHRFLDKTVLLTGEPEVLNTANGRNAFLFSIRLLVRICQNVSIFLPESMPPLLSEARQVAAQIAFVKAVEFTASADKTKFDAVLSIGKRVEPSLPWTVINSNGWVARVSSGDKPLSGDCSLDNPIGALGAVCLGAGEVFKRLIALDPTRGELLNGFSFSLLTLSAEPENYGPPLPSIIDTDLLVVGAGAIGNGIVALLCNLPITGKIVIVDHEKFEDENLGTCLLIGPQQIPKDKAAIMESIMTTSGKDAEGFVGTFEEYSKSLKGNYPTIVLNGLDNIEVRHEVQRTFWPDLIVDGAIGDFGCQVSCHPWADNVACLLCLFRQPVRTAETAASEASGLVIDRVMQPDVPVTEADVAAAPIQKKEFLRARIGKSVCSVVSEAVIQKISEDAHDSGFEPSVPFVAAFSASMVVAQAITHIAGWHSALDTRFQFDFMRGPGYGEQYPQERRTDCICQRRKNINRLRTMHRHRKICPPTGNNPGNWHLNLSDK